MEIIHAEILLIHYFYESLSEVAFMWFMQLDNSKIRRWKDLMDAFLKQYQFNMDVSLDQSNLRAMEKKSTEMIKEYA